MTTLVKKTKILKEFPATEISFIDCRQYINPVVFCLTGKELNNNFFNCWTAFLFMLYHENRICEPHLINSGFENLKDSRNAFYPENYNNDTENMSDHLWNYDYIFFIDKSINYFKINDISKFIAKMNTNKSIDILSYGKFNNTTLNTLDFKFCIIRKNVFENIQYPWFTTNEYIDEEILSKLKNIEVEIIFDEDCSII